MPADSSYAARPWLASYEKGVPHEVEVPDLPLTSLLDAAAEEFPTRPAIAFLGTRITWRDLRETVDRFAAALAGLRVERGDRVALLLPNCPQNVIGFFATLRLGAVVVECNPLSTPAELTHQLGDCGATVVVCLDRTLATLQTAVASGATQVRSIVVASVTDYLPPVDKLRLLLPLASARRARAAVSAPVPADSGAHLFLDLLRAHREAAPQAPVSGADLALLQYTTGTTGPSKGAMLSHANLQANVRQCAAWLVGARRGREVTLAVLPLFHAYGLTLCLGLNTLLAGELVLLPRFDQDQLLAAVDAHRPTLFPGVPPIYKALADNPKSLEHDLTTITACVSGAMRLPTETQEAFSKLLGRTGRLVEGYGMTETSPVTHCNPLGGGAVTGSVGLPVPSTEALILDPDDPTEVIEPGGGGELAVRGPQVFGGYWGQPAESAAILVEVPGHGGGWVLTGDIAVMDDDGFFTVVDRKKEIIIAGGFNIYPTEVEEVLAEVPGVAEACVIGIPDRYRGETVKAFVVREPGSTVDEEQLRLYATAELAGYKVPRQWEFRDELPRVTVGKVLRRVLREEEAAKAAKVALAAGSTGRPANTPGGKGAANRSASRSETR